MEDDTQGLPVSRQFPRFTLNAPIIAHTREAGSVTGWCRNVGEGGLCANLAANLPVGSEVKLRLALPGFAEPLQLHAIVRHIRGARYGFEFRELPVENRARIRQFGEAVTTAAHLISSHPPVLRELQRTLQHLGVAHVSFGPPKVLPVREPTLIAVDCEFPNYLQVMQFLRAEAGRRSIVILAVLSGDTEVKKAHQHGADLTICKPVSGILAQRSLSAAFNLLRREPPSYELHSVNAPFVEERLPGRIGI